MSTSEDRKNYNSVKNGEDYPVLFGYLTNYGEIIAEWGTRYQQHDEVIDPESTDNPNYFPFRYVPNVQTCFWWSNVTEMQKVMTNIELRNKFNIINRIKHKSFYPDDKDQDKSIFAKVTSHQPSFGLEQGAEFPSFRKWLKLQNENASVT